MLWGKRKMFDHLAYIDPSTGSMFIQAVFGVGLAIGVALRGTIGAMFSKLKLSLSRKTTDEEA